MSDYITYFELASFLASLLAWPVLRRSAYLRLFPLLLLIVVSAEVYQTFAPPEVKLRNSSFYNIQVPAQHFVYMLILWISMEELSRKRIMVAAIVAFVAFTLIATVFLTAPGRFNVLSYCVGSILIIAGILMKFYEMLQKPSDFNFLKKPFFYLLFAFLLFNVGTLPYFAMANWLYFMNTHKELVTVLISVMSVLNYILYSVYTTTFAWMILRKDFS